MSYVEYREQGGEVTMRHYMVQWASGFEWKILLSMIGTVISVIQGFYGEIMWGFIALFLIDLTTGLLKSKYKGVPITSRKLRASVTKLGAYMLLITALIVTSRYEQSFLPIVTVTYYYFMFTELKSIFENVEEMGVKLPRSLFSKVNTFLDEDITEIKKEGKDDDIAK